MCVCVCVEMYVCMYVCVYVCMEEVNTLSAQVQSMLKNKALFGKVSICMCVCMYV